MTSLHIITTILRHDIAFAWRNPYDVIASIAFFAIIIALIPLTVGTAQATLQNIAPAMIWIAAMLATLPQLDLIFRRKTMTDHLDNLLMIPLSLPITLIAKAFAAWLVLAIPLIVAAPIMGIMLGIPISAMPLTMLALALGIFSLILIGMTIAAMLIGTKRGTILIAILILPLAMPTLIFGTATTAAAINGTSTETPLMLLTAITLIMIAIMPQASAISLRYAAE